MTVNAAMAGRAYLIAEQARPGTLARRAAGSVSIAYATTRTPDHARQILASLGAELRQECLDLADQLTTQIQEEGS
ncbi:hypothetical protein ACLQ2R_19585 [Streptosporangium sp. DT93]|uniref:hypothetical protein n=1 Tax=Streptosporangium sp. DT93 TaxID=3393428 RepID=UPI003CF08B77